MVFYWCRCAGSDVDCLAGTYGLAHAIRGLQRRHAAVFERTEGSRKLTGRGDDGLQPVGSFVTRGQIAGWVFWLGVATVSLGPVGYKYYQVHTPAGISEAQATQAGAAKQTHQLLARLACTSHLAPDDGTKPAETVARAIIAKCGPMVPAPEGPPCSTDPKCMQGWQRLMLEAETKGVLDERYQRAQAKADDAKAALERAEPN